MSERMWREADGATEDQSLLFADLVYAGGITQVEIDYEALAIWLADEDDMAGLIVASMDEYRRLARSHALRLGLGGGNDEVPGV